MNRRQVLKALGIMPIVGAFGGCGRALSKPAPGPDKDRKVHTLQILLEGAFAVVLQKQSRRLTAFVPRPDVKREDLAHLFYFNDPEVPKAIEKSKEYRFELSGEGLHRYPNTALDPYINPGFSDFRAETEKWRLPPSLVVLDLPFPRSINFSGRPLSVKFGKDALKPSGLMPTNYILEYRVDDDSKVRFKCDDPGTRCSPSPNCPPGVLRYYFGVGPRAKDAATRQRHAIAFFNFLLASSFPDLVRKYELVEIEASDYELPGSGGGYPTRSKVEEIPQVVLSSVALREGTPTPRLLPVASLVDCQLGGLLVTTNTGPTE